MYRQLKVRSQVAIQVLLEPDEIQPPFFRMDSTIHISWTNTLTFRGVSDVNYFLSVFWSLTDKINIDGARRGHFFKHIKQLMCIFLFLFQKSGAAIFVPKKNNNKNTMNVYAKHFIPADIRGLAVFNQGYCIKCVIF